MKKILPLLLLVFIFSTAFSEKEQSSSTMLPNENTVIIPGNIFFPVSHEEQPNYRPAPIVQLPTQQNQSILDGNEWVPKDSVFIDAFIPAGGHLGVKFNSTDGRFEIISSTVLDDAAQAAVEKTPSWIRLKLYDTFSKLSFKYQGIYAKIILDAEDPLIDEIAFTIAYSSPAYLSSAYCFPEIFKENASLIYENDKSLDYVAVVDYGNSSGNDDYYSTVKYRRMNSEGIIDEVEVPKDIYYMYIVFPKLSDEIQTYVDPGRYEHDQNYQNHIYNISSPPLGILWRDYLFTHTEPIPGGGGDFFPVLKDEIAGCDILWNDQDPKGTSAVRIMTKWINDVMDFTSKSERPHQPARIYKLHLGRCGEHEDLTNAVSRTCLVPCRGISRISTDHVWNEFWDMQWEQWEPVNNWIKNKNAEGNTNLGTCFARRSDGVLEFVTDDYLKGDPSSTLNISVVDNNKQPVDGATVVLYIREIDGDKIYFDSFQATDQDGNCTFIVGTKRDYFVRVLTKIGNVPIEDNIVSNLVSKPQGSREYNFSIQVGGAKPVVECNFTEPPEDTEQDYCFKADFTNSGQFIQSRLLLNDLSGEITTKEVHDGNMCFFVTDDESFAKCTGKEEFNACVKMENINKFPEPVTFSYPDDNDWYAFLSNGKCLDNSIHVKGYFTLYSYEFVSVDDDPGPDGSIDNVSCYPNPAQENTFIKFYIEHAGRVKVEIFDLNGALIKAVIDKPCGTGEHIICWNGTNNDNTSVTPGLYVYKITMANCIKTGKVSIVR